MPGDGASIQLLGHQTGGPGAELPARCRDWAEQLQLETLAPALAAQQGIDVEQQLQQGRVGGSTRVPGVVAVHERDPAATE